MDIIDLQSELASFKKEFTLCPRYWETLKDMNEFEWESHPFDPKNLNEIPNEKGIYSFVINPQLSNHPQRYLCYIGKTDRTLKNRFYDYLIEMKNSTKRPKITYLLNKWNGYIEFCCIVLRDVDLSSIEKKLLIAFMPPCNDQLPAEVSKIVGAF